MEFSFGISIGVCGTVVQTVEKKIVQDAIESPNKNIVCLRDIDIGIIVLQLIAITGAYFLQSDMGKKDDHHKKDAAPIKDFRTLSHK